jgi:hypothetical protein
LDDEWSSIAYGVVPNAVKKQCTHNTQPHICTPPSPTARSSTSGFTTGRDKSGGHFKQRVVVGNGWAHNASAALFMQGLLFEEEARQMMEVNVTSGTT